MTPSERSRKYDAIQASMLGDTYGQRVLLPPPRRSEQERQLVELFRTQLVGAIAQPAVGTTSLAVSSSGVQKIDNVSQKEPEPVEQAEPITKRDEPEFKFAQPPAPVTEPAKTEQVPVNFDNVSIAQPESKVEPQPIFDVAATLDFGKLPTELPKPAEPIDIISSVAPVFEQPIVADKSSSTKQDSFDFATDRATHSPTEHVRPSFNFGTGQQVFEFNGPQTSQDDTAERPQPPASAGGGGNHPFRLLNFSAPPPDPSPPFVDAKGQQQTNQAADLVGALDAGLERTLLLLDRIVASLVSYSQRLSIIEEILDRSE